MEIEANQKQFQLDVREQNQIKMQVSKNINTSSFSLETRNNRFNLSATAFGSLIKEDVRM